MNQEEFFSKCTKLQHKLADISAEGVQDSAVWCFVLVDVMKDILAKHPEHKKFYKHICEELATYKSEEKQ